MALAAPTRLAERASAVWPTGSRRMEGRSKSRAPWAAERASPPRSRSAARRCDAATSVDLRPGLVEALERGTRIHRGNGCEAKVALLVHGEADRDIRVEFDAVEGDPVTLHRVCPALRAEAAVFQVAVLQGDRIHVR